MILSAVGDACDYTLVLTRRADILSIIYDVPIHQSQSNFLLEVCISR